MAFYLFPSDGKCRASYEDDYGILNRNKADIITDPLRHWRDWMNKGSPIYRLQANSVNERKEGCGAKFSIRALLSITMQAVSCAEYPMPYLQNVWAHVSFHFVSICRIILTRIELCKLYMIPCLMGMLLTFDMRDFARPECG